MHLTVEFEQEDDGKRWIAEVVELPGCLAYGRNRYEAAVKVQALALRVIADQIENYEIWSGPMTISFAEAV